ncbi:MAG: cation:proton antiporter [Neisseriaceae bacterium]|nr:cation:proton antiporter [Neisseriaceae bacterium]
MHALDSVVMLLAVAVLTVIICRRLHIPTMLGYLIVGFIAGPGVLHIISQTEATDFVGEIGIVFLMFSIGLEFSLPKLRAMKSLVFGLGSMQVIFTMLLIIGIGLILRMPFLVALALAGAMTVSSTAIVSKMMASRGELGSHHGQMVMGVLLMQDIAVVPLMILMHTLAGDTSTLWEDLGFALLKMAVVLFVLLYLGEKLMQPWFNLVAKLEQSEVFMLNVLLVTLGVAYLTELAGLSLALGAFVAGMLIAETQYRFQVEDDIRPFRDTLLGFFFITVGMKLDTAVLFDNYIQILSFLAVLIVLKAFVVYLVSRMGQHKRKDSFQAALYLAQGGEFGFVLLALALKDHLIAIDFVQIGTAAILLSMLIAPILIGVTPWIANKIFRQSWDEKAVDLHQMLVENMSKSDHVIIIGFGRTGQTVGRMLKAESINYYALDNNAERVQAARLAGEPIAFGDAKRKDILLAAGLKRARMVILTSHLFKENEHILSVIMAESPTLPVIVRSNSDDNARILGEKGASGVISDEQETGLVLASEVMLYYGMPFYRVYNIIRGVRQDKYGMLKDIYLGDDEKAAAQGSKSIYRDSIQLPQGAFAVGRELRALPFTQLKIELIGIRRGTQLIKKPAAEFTLIENDVVLVIGLPANVERLKHILLSGEK